MLKLPSFSTLVHRYTSTLVSLVVLLLTSVLVFLLAPPAHAVVPGPTCTELPPKIDPKANYCETNQDFGEVTPGCVYASSLDLLFCQGNNYRACATGQQIPAPTFGQPDKNYYLPADEFPSGKILYNGAEYNVPAGGVHICTSNVFACANSACLGGDGAEAGLITPRFEGRTEDALDKTKRFGGTIEYETNINVSANQTAVTSVGTSGLLSSEQVSSILSRIRAALGRDGNERKLPSPTFPFLNVLSEVNKRLTPAGYNPRIETGQIKSYSFNPVCQVAINVQEPPLPRPGPQLEEVLAFTVSNIETEARTVGKIEYQMPAEWGEQIGTSKITQALFAPGKKVGSQIVVKNPPPPDENAENAYLSGGCPQGTGNQVIAAKNTATEETILPASFSFFDKITNFLSFADFMRGIIDKVIGFFAGGFTTKGTLYITHADKNICVGCTDLGDQITGAEGFINAFLPASERVNTADAEEQADKEVEASPGEVQSVETVFGNVGNINEGWEKLKKAVTPLRFQTGAQTQIFTRTTLESGPALPPNVVIGQGLYNFLGEPKSSLLKQRLEETARSANIPLAILAAVARIEGGAMWSYSDSQIQADQGPNCTPNNCSAAGPMQFTTGAQNAILTGLNACPAAKSGYWNAENWPNAWARWGEGGDVCSIQDSFRAAARKLKHDAGAEGMSAQQWTCDTATKAGTAYYGECNTSYERLYNMTYCEFLCEALRSQ